MAKMFVGCDGSSWAVTEVDTVGVHLDAAADGLYRRTDGDSA